MSNMIDGICWDLEPPRCEDCGTNLTTAEDRMCSECERIYFWEKWEDEREMEIGHSGVPLPHEEDISW